MLPLLLWPSVDITDPAVPGITASYFSLYPCSVTVFNLNWLRTEPCVPAAHEANHRLTDATCQFGDPSFHFPAEAHVTLLGFC